MSFQAQPPKPLSPILVLAYIVQLPLLRTLCHPLHCVCISEQVVWHSDEQIWFRKSYADTALPNSSTHFPATNFIVGCTKLHVELLQGYTGTAIVATIPAAATHIRHRMVHGVFLRAARVYVSVE